MEQTTHYKLNQWVKTDRIMMEDFNSDNEKLDTALYGLAASGEAIQAAVDSERSARQTADTALETAIAGRGNCFVTWGSYVGDEELEKTLTFERPPVMVIIWNRSNYASPNHLVLIRGSDRANGYGSSSANYVSVYWNGNSVNWQHSGNPNAEYNKSSEQYYYVAFLTADTVS